MAIELTPETTGASLQACAAAIAIIELDGMRPVRESLDDPSYGVAFFTAHLARVIDSHFKPAA